MPSERDGEGTAKESVSNTSSRNSTKESDSPGNSARSLEPDYFNTSFQKFLELQIAQDGQPPHPTNASETENSLAGLLREYQAQTGKSDSEFVKYFFRNFEETIRTRRPLVVPKLGAKAAAQYEAHRSKEESMPERIEARILADKLYKEFLREETMQKQLGHQTFWEMMGFGAEDTSK